MGNISSKPIVMKEKIPYKHKLTCTSLILGIKKISVSKFRRYHEAVARASIPRRNT